MNQEEREDARPAYLYNKVFRVMRRIMNLQFLSVHCIIGATESGYTEASDTSDPDPAIMILFMPADSEWDMSAEEEEVPALMLLSEGFE